ncbi:exocyst complex component EXO70B1-like [Glycine soja]|uniref:Exocyst subunit Exo70 family protein n=1 Tax=Glycine soja TaxID=3848 RepID=A0A445KC71_GLYSO|nr:exocyst complex component EXO70B1-like [Glycine soja]RZC08395.1 Exocyst complex component EXO70B1 [Glycine soja]
MVFMLIMINIQIWLQKPKVWRFVCFFSSVVGLLCYAYSSSFNNLFGKWTWCKILLYIGFSFIICLTVLFANVWECSTSPRVEAHMAFFILMITSVYSFFFDKVVKGKPDAYSLVSCAAFAIMSLALSRLSHFGFEVDLLVFFSGLLILQLMKIKLWLVIVGGSFSYSLFILRSSLVAPRSGHDHGLQDRDHDHGLQDRVPHHVIDLGSHSQSQGTRTSPSVTQVDSTQAIVSVAQEADSPPEIEDLGLLVTESQQRNNDSDNNSIVTQFMGCIEALKKENENVILTIFKHAEEYLKASLVQTPDLQLHCDDNLVVDSLPSVIINDLRECVRLMVTAGLKEECIDVYITWRREFLGEMLSWLIKFKIGRFYIKALCVADRILLPNERRLCECVFEGSIPLEDKYPALPGIHRFGFRKSLDSYPALRDKLLIGLGILSPHGIRKFGELLSLTYGVKEKAIVPGGRVHQITLDVLDYAGIIDVQLTVLLDSSLEGKFPLNNIAMITNLLDSSLEANSQNYHDPILGYVFIINNRSYIRQRAMRGGLRHILGNDWIRKNTTSIKENLQLYLRSSWNKILDILKLDINESEPNVAAQLMKNKLRSFNEHFDDICNIQSTWFVFTKELRRKIIQSIEKILLQAYGNFIGRLQDFIGNQAYEHIEYGMFDIQDRLNNLFLVRE